MFDFIMIRRDIHYQLLIINLIIIIIMNLI